MVPLPRSALPGKRSCLLTARPPRHFLESQGPASWVGLREEPEHCRMGCRANGGAQAAGTPREHRCSRPAGPLAVGICPCRAQTVAHRDSERGRNPGLTKGHSTPPAANPSPRTVPSRFSRKQHTNSSCLWTGVREGPWSEHMEGWGPTERGALCLIRRGELSPPKQECENMRIGNRHSGRTN